MSFDLTDKRRLLGVANNTSETVKELHDLNQKMDKQIALMKRLVNSLERREDNGK
jgi:hypothetical protein